LSDWKRERAIRRSKELDIVLEEKDEDVDDSQEKKSKMSSKKIRKSLIRNKRLKSF